MTCFSLSINGPGLISVQCVRILVYDIVRKKNSSDYVQVSIGFLESTNTRIYLHVVNDRAGFLSGMLECLTLPADGCNFPFGFDQFPSTKMICVITREIILRTPHNSNVVGRPSHVRQERNPASAGFELTATALVRNA